MSDDEFDYEEYRDEEDYEEGWRWSCCGENRDDEGCQKTKHKAKISVEAGNKKRKVGQ